MDILVVVLKPRYTRKHERKESVEKERKDRCDTSIRRENGFEIKNNVILYGATQKRGQKPQIQGKC